MTVPKNRSNSMSKKFIKAPQGKTTVHYSRRKTGACHYCSETGEKLSGVSSGTHVSKSRRTPNRIFGGELSAKFTGRVLRLRSRLKSGALELAKIPLNLRKYMPEVK